VDGEVEERVVVVWWKKAEAWVGRVAARDGVASTTCCTLCSIHPSNSESDSRGQSASV
jgi:hypothetical protein